MSLKAESRKAHVGGSVVAPLKVDSSETHLSGLVIGGAGPCDLEHDPELIMLRMDGTRRSVGGFAVTERQDPLWWKTIADELQYRYPVEDMDNNLQSLSPSSVCHPPPDHRLLCRVAEWRQLLADTEGNVPLPGCPPTDVKEGIPLERSNVVA